MELYELTEEKREQMTDELFKKLSIERKHLSREALEKEIIDYLSKKTPLFPGYLWQGLCPADICRRLCK